MFERAHHQRIAKVLHALDAAVLREHRCFFGGGTAIALRFGEYRESVDIDFLVSELEHYRHITLQLAQNRRPVCSAARKAQLLRQVKETLAQGR